MKKTNQVRNAAAWLRIGYVVGCVCMATPALAATGEDVIQSLGVKALGVLFTLAGVAGALAFAVTGIKLTLSSLGGSSMRMSDALMSLGACALGIAIAFLGPTISENLIKGLGGIKKDIYVP
jgi:hypothetical protein